MMTLLRSQSGVSLTQVMVGMGVSSIAMLAFMQMTEFTMRSNKSSQISMDFTNLTATVNQLLMTQGVCAKVLGGQDFKDQVGPQNIAILNPDPAATGEYISTAKNPYSPGLAIKQMTLTKTSGSAGKYLAQLSILAEKQGQTVGGKFLTSAHYVNIDTAADKIVGCSGGGDYIKRTGDTVSGPLILPTDAPTDPRQAVSKSYVQNLVDAAGAGGGGSCFETNGACNSPYVQVSTVTRTTCYYFWSSAGSVAVATNSLVGCPSSGHYNATAYPVSGQTKICCK